jgi:hypothetical protein
MEKRFLVIDTELPVLGPDDCNTCQYEKLRESDDVCSRCLDMTGAATNWRPKKKFKLRARIVVVYENKKGEFIV